MAMEVNRNHRIIGAEIIGTECDPSLDAWIDKFGLNDDSRVLLYSVHPEVAALVIKSFAPKCIAPYDKVFQSFCRSKAMKFFSRQWNLSHVSSDMLFHASPAVQLDAMATFQPRTLTSRDDVNPLFTKFLTSKLRRHGELTQDSPVESFCRKWQLDSEARSALEGVPLGVAEKIMRDFEPRDAEAEQVNARFMAFIKSRVPSVATKQATSAPTKGAATIGAPISHKVDKNIREFIRAWDLSRDCQTILEELPLGIRCSVMADFKPHPEANIEKNFRAFVDSRRSQSDTHFIQRFDLDADSQAFLSELEPHTREEVMEDFAPKDSGNMNPLFMSFARSVQRRLEGNAIDCTPTRKKSVQRREFKVKDSTPQRRKRTKETPVEDFCEKWKLDHTCMQRLAQLPSDVQAQVIKDFEPKDLRTESFIKLFLSFLRSREAAHHERTVSGTSGGKEAALSPIRRKRTGESAVELFCDKWDLDRTCKTRLAELPPDIQTRIMKEFRPNDLKKATYVPLFLSFLHSREAALLGEETSTSSRAAHEPRRGSRRDAAQLAQLVAIGKFAKKNHLSSLAVKTLERLEPEVQNLVMAHFDTDLVTGDLSSTFIKFCVRKSKKRSSKDKERERPHKSRRLA